MALDRFLSLIASILGAIGSVYVLRSLMSLTPDVTAKLASTHWDYSTAQLDSISSQRAESLVGATIIFVALGVAVVNTVLAPAAVPFAESRQAGLLTAALFALLVVIAGVVATRVLKRKHRQAASRAIVAQYVRTICEQGRITIHEVNGLRSYAKELLGLDLPHDMPARTILEKVANEAGVSVPPSVALE